MPDEKKETIHIVMPEIYPGMTTARITFWIFEEDEIEEYVPTRQRKKEQVKI